MPGWTRVTVEKTRTTRFAVAADASAEGKAQLRGLPDAPHEFLGAVLGVNVRNWLNLLDRIRTMTDLNQLLSECDELAIAFLTSLVRGSGIGQGAMARNSHRSAAGGKGSRCQSVSVMNGIIGCSSLSP